MIRLACQALVAEGRDEFASIVRDLEKPMHRDNRRTTSDAELYAHVCAVVGTDNAEVFDSEGR